MLSQVGYCGESAACHQPFVKGLCSILNIFSKNPILGKALKRLIKAFCRAILCLRGGEIHGAFPLTEQVLNLGKSLQEVMIT